MDKLSLTLQDHLAVLGGQLTAEEDGLTTYTNPDEPLLQVVVSSDTKATLKETFLKAWTSLLSKNYRFNNYKHTWYMGGTPEQYGPYELEPYIMP